MRRTGRRVGTGTSIEGQWWGTGSRAASTMRGKRRTAAHSRLRWACQTISAWRRVAASAGGRSWWKSKYFASVDWFRRPRLIWFAGGSHLVEKMRAVSEAPGLVAALWIWSMAKFWRGTVLMGVRV